MEARPRRPIWRWRGGGPVVLVLVALAAALLAGAAHATTKKVSDYFIVCHRSNPDFSGCIKRSVEDAKPRLVQGMPEIRLPPIDPLRIEKMELQEGQGTLLFVLRLKNVSITGMKDFSIRSAQADIQKGTFRLDLLTPHMHIDSQYEMEGRLLALPLQGHGQCVMDFYGVSTVCDVKLRNITRNGKAYNQVETLKWKIDVENSSSYFSNLFNGDKTLGETTNKFLNENAKEAFQTYKHLPEEAFSQFFTEVENRFFELFDLEELYPE